MYTKNCQLFSRPGVKSIRIQIRNDLKSRMRIRTKSFRIHNTANGISWVVIIWRVCLSLYPPKNVSWLWVITKWNSSWWRHYTMSILVSSSILLPPFPVPCYFTGVFLRAQNLSFFSQLSFLLFFATYPNFCFCSKPVPVLCCLPKARKRFIKGFM